MGQTHGFTVITGQHVKILELSWLLIKKIEYILAPQEMHVKLNHSHYHSQVLH